MFYVYFSNTPLNLSSDNNHIFDKLALWKVNQFPLFVGCYYEILIKCQHTLATPISNTCVCS